MPYKIVAYACEHGCGKVYKLKNSCKSHENRCFWNHKNQACASCDNQDENRFCLESGANLNIKGELRKYCEAWRPKVEPGSDGFEGAIHD